MIAATRREEQPSVKEELKNAAADVIFGPAMAWSPPSPKDNYVPTRIARLRYRFLALHYEEAKKEQFHVGPPDDPSLRSHWERFKETQEAVKVAKRAVEAAERSLSRKEKIRDEAWEDYAEATIKLLKPEVDPREGPLKASTEKRGPEGNVHHREPARALIRLFYEIFDVQPRRSDEGPLVRFVTAFFDGLEGDWFWLDAERFEPRHRHERMRKFNEKLGTVQRPRAIKDIIRHAIDAEREGKPSEHWDGGPQLFNGYFIRLLEGEAGLAQNPPISPQICRLQPRPDTR